MNVINKWANFMKHPKEFLFTHWPTYYFEGMPVDIKEGDIKIDTDFILQHYSSDKDPRPVILANNAKVFVQIPDLLSTTTKFCEELNIFFAFITGNQIVADHLKSKTVIMDTFEQSLTVAPEQYGAKTEHASQDSQPVQE